MARGAVTGALATTRTQAALIGLFALATAMMVAAARVFTSYLVFVADQSQRATIAIVVAAVFAFPVVAGLIGARLGNRRVVTGTVALIIAARLLLQFVEQPIVRTASGGVVILAWGVLAVLLFATARREAGIGFVLGLALDLAMLAGLGPLGLPWSPGLPEHAVTLVLAGATLACWLPGREGVRSIPVGATWRIAASLIAVGPALALFHLVTGNVAFVSTHTGMSIAGSSALLGLGMILGVFIAALRLLAIGAGGASGLLVARFIVFDALIGAVSLSFAWSGDGLAALGVVFAALTATELIIFALIVDEDVELGGITPVAVVFTAGMLLHFAALFLYYTSTGGGWLLAVVWVVLVIGAFLATGPLPAELARRRLTLTPAAVPAAVAAGLLIAAPLLALARSESPDYSDATPDSLRVITYNIQSGFSRDNYWDLEATARVIEDSGADIVLLQEVSRGWLVTSGNDQLRWLSARLDMPYAWGGASLDDLWGNAILSRYPIVDERLMKFESTGNLRRAGLAVTIQPESGRAFDVVVTHLDNPSEAGDIRDAQLAQLLDLLTMERPTILGGDFNMTPDDPGLGRLLELGLIDAAATAGGAEPTSEDGRRIDYIFVSEDFTVIDATVIDSDASDHFPVVVTLGLP